MQSDLRRSSLNTWVYGFNAHLCTVFFLFGKLFHYPLFKEVAVVEPLMLGRMKDGALYTVCVCVCFVIFIGFSYSFGGTHCLWD